MRHLKLEKSIKKLDRELEALQISKKYLVNSLDEIDEVREILNNIDLLAYFSQWFPVDK